ncbi:MAG TPA: Gfo/Idh/MocA family oxidoreductase [Candidatus Hydrogenedentes bacterium]|nr:Gfo/Idh/MocA family oxidoreductase [Candidatus Hydrogenedentota bacterium]
MATDRKVRIGFIGTGGMGQCAHLKNYAALGDCEVVALAELRPRLAERVAERYGVPTVYADHRALLDGEDVDALVASQPFTRHGVLLPELLATGKPVFSEKPLAACIEVGERIVEAERAGSTFLMLGYHKRSDPATMYAKAQIDALVASGELGRMTYVRILMPAGDWIAGGFDDLIPSDDPFPELDFDPPPSDMDQAAFEEYNAFVNYYIHQVNLMRHVLGEGYSVRYVAPSGVLLAVESASGVAGTIEMSPYATTVDWQEHALVCFEHGYVRIDLPAPLASNRPGRVEILRDPGAGATPETVVPQLPWRHAMRQQAMNFIAAVRGDAAPLCTAAEALEDLKNAREWLQLKHGV